MSLNEEKALNTLPAEKMPLAKKPFGKKGRLVSLLGGAVIFLLVVAALIYKDKLSDFGQYGYLGAFIISIAGGATVVVPIPALVVVFTLGGILNPLLVGLVAGLGEAIGGVVDYMVGYGGHSAVLLTQERWEKIYHHIQGWVKRRGSLALFISSSVLNPFFTFISATAGALRFPLWKFFLACWAGKTIKGLSIAYLGHWGLRFIFRWLDISV